METNFYRGEYEASSMELTQSRFEPLYVVIKPWSDENVIFRRSKSNDIQGDHQEQRKDLSSKR